MWLTMQVSCAREGDDWRVSAIPDRIALTRPCQNEAWSRVSAEEYGLVP